MNACIACGGDRSTPRYTGLRRCATCGHVWADLDVSHEELVAHYSRSYFFGEEYSDYVADRPLIERNFSLRYRTLRRFLKSGTHRRLFELGCAYGFFLNLVRAEFDEVSGIDVTADGIRYAHEQLGLDVRQGDLLTTDLGDRRIDVACAWDTIEHLGRPDAYVGRLAAHMPPGSILALTTGDIGSLNARVKGERWRLIHPPTHVHYFSKNSIAKMLDRHGFDVVHVEHAGFYRDVVSMAHNILSLRWGFDAAGNWIRRNGPSGFHLYLNLFDIMFVVAAKRPS